MQRKANGRMGRKKTAVGFIFCRVCLFTEARARVCVCVLSKIV